MGIVDAGKLIPATLVPQMAEDEQVSTKMWNRSLPASVVPVKAYLNAPAHNDEALPNTTFRATEMAGSSVLGSARFIRHY
jgi:hypothetical protein